MTANGDLRRVIREEVALISPLDVIEQEMQLEAPTWIGFCRSWRTYKTAWQ